jgi:outer membrane protein assembly factor BamE (lipoprotein component of BamABCDE complex)
MKYMKPKTSKFLLLAAATFLAAPACTPTVAQRGNMLEDQQMKTIIPGIHTRSDVLRILGSPTTQAPFNDDVWYYIGQETEKKGILDPDVTKERVVVVVFNPDSTVYFLKEMPKGASLDVPIERSKTPTHGNDMTIMQQMLGNIGRFNSQPNSSPTRPGR